MMTSINPTMEIRADRLDPLTTITLDEGPQRLTPLTFEEVILPQLITGLTANPRPISSITFVYQPAWASHGLMATDILQIKIAHRQIRDFIREWWGKENARQVRIIYGGQCRQEWTADLIADQNIDGILGRRD